MAKILVAYFSASGVTAAAARGIAAAVGGELFEIVPAERYTSADLDWTDRKSRSTIEMNDEKCRPAMAVPVPDLGEFDTVFVGFPVWCMSSRASWTRFLKARDLRTRRSYLSARRAAAASRARSGA